VNSGSLNPALALPILVAGSTPPSTAIRRFGSKLKVKQDFNHKNIKLNATSQVASFALDCLGLANIF
jgi:hypothetical protein